MKGKVQTVLGPVDPGDLGMTSMHEHLIIDFTVVFQAPTEATMLHRAHQPVTMDILGWVRYDPFRSYDNLRIRDKDVAIDEVRRYGISGGGTICDVTTVGIGRDPTALAHIARATGVNAVMGAGYYIAASHPNVINDLSEDDITAEIIGDITSGVGPTAVKAGIIGELGCSWPLTDNERRVLRAGARAQQETGAAVLIHPGRDETAPFEILDVLEEAGAAPERVVMGHLGRTYQTTDPILRLAERGCYLEWDQFGWESSYFSYGILDFPSDAQRLDQIKTLVDAGYADKIVTGQDICCKTHTATYGGYGYAHLIDNIVPRMHDKVGSKATQGIMVDNPARVLTLV